MQQRLQKILAGAGIASRRKCEAIITSGRVCINGVAVTQLGTQADPNVDTITIDGHSLAIPSTTIYLVLNKPTGYVCTMADRHAAQTVMDLVHGVGSRVFPVGRLDADSAGLLFFTNDGNFAEMVTHPSHHLHKTYRVVVPGKVPPGAMKRLRVGVPLDGDITAPAGLRFISYERKTDTSVFDITLREGRNRQVRRMFELVGYRVLALTRTRIGSIQLQGLPPGSFRHLTSEEVAELLTDAATQPGAAKTKRTQATKPRASGQSASPRIPGATHGPARYSAPREYGKVGNEASRTTSGTHTRDLKPARRSITTDSSVQKRSRRAKG